MRLIKVHIVVVVSIKILKNVVKLKIKKYFRKMYMNFDRHCHGIWIYKYLFILYFLKNI